MGEFKTILDIALILLVICLPNIIKYFRVKHLKYLDNKYKEKRPM